MIKRLIILTAIFSFYSSSQLFAQDESLPKIDSSDMAMQFIKTGNIKRDSAEVHLKNKDKKGADKLYAEAIKDYKKALKVNSKSYTAYYQMAMSFSKRKDYKNAIANFDKAIKIDTTKFIVYRERGIALANFGKNK